jgi:hypothetical protein
MKEFYLFFFFWEIKSFGDEEKLMFDEYKGRKSCQYDLRVDYFKGLILRSLDFKISNSVPTKNADQSKKQQMSQNSLLYWSHVNQMLEF